MTQFADGATSQPNGYRKTEFSFTKVGDTNSMSLNVVRTFDFGRASHRTINTVNERSFVPHNAAKRCERKHSMTPADEGIAAVRHDDYMRQKFNDAVCAVEQMNDYEELERLNRVVVVRMRTLNGRRENAAALAFSIGQQVEFTSKSGVVHQGTVSKVNRKSVGVQ